MTEISSDRALRCQVGQIYHTRAHNLYALRARENL